MGSATASPSSARRVVLKAVAYPLLLGGLLLALQRLDDYSDIEEVGYKAREVEALAAETVFLGSSHTYRHVDVARFDSLRGGGSSYNFGLRGGSAFEFHYQAERMLRLPHVKHLVLELRGVDPRMDLANRDNRRTYYYHDLRRVRLASRASLAFDAPLIRRLRIALGRFGVGLDHYLLPGQGDALLAERLYEPEPFSLRDRRGFAALSMEEERRRVELFLTKKGQAAFARKKERMREPAGTPTRADSVMAAIWLGLYRRAEAQGVEVYFVEQIGDVKDWGGLAEVLGAALPPGRLVSLNDLDRYPGLFDPALWFDSGHLNARGARYFTDLLADLLPATL